MKANVRVFNDHKSLSIAATEIFIEAAVHAVQARGRFLVALSGGGTPTGLYRLLTEESYRQRVDWSQTFVFWGDERCVAPEDPGSNYHQAMQILLSQVPIPDENILRVKGELDPPKASEEYAQTLERFAPPELNWPRFDLVLLGMGADGHTASLFPGSQVGINSSTLAVTANYEDRPANRVTLTPLVFNSARNILFLVTGENKASTLKDVLSDTYQPELLPVQRIRPTDGKIIWLVDEAAASALPNSEV